MRIDIDASTAIVPSFRPRWRSGHSRRTRRPRQTTPARSPSGHLPTDPLAKAVEYPVNCSQHERPLSPPTSRILQRNHADLERDRSLHPCQPRPAGVSPETYEAMAKNPKPSHAFIVAHGETPAGHPLRGAVVAIGNFDGVHRGHQAVIARACARATELKRPAAAL